MMRRVVIALLAVAGLLATLPATPVGAAEASGAPQMAVQIWPEADPGKIIVIVSAQAAEGQKLPATVDLPLIEGAEVLWAGEIMGTDPSQDIQQTPKTVDAASGKAVRVAYTKGQSVQYEATMPGLTVNGTSVKASMKWVQTTEASKTSFAVRLPAGISDVSVRPAPAVEPQKNPAGESLYTLPDRALAAGDDVTIDIAYTKGGAITPEQTGDGFSLRSSLPWILGVVALLLAAVAVALHSRSKSASAE